MDGKGGYISPVLQERIQAAAGRVNTLSSCLSVPFLKESASINKKIT